MAPENEHNKICKRPKFKKYNYQTKSIDNLLLELSNNNKTC